MLKRFILIASVALFSLGSQAQYVFDEGDIAINAGFGFLSADGLLPSINVSAELGLIPTGDIGVISAGGAVEYKYSELLGYNYHQFSIGPRAAWHLKLPFLENSNYDLYAGIGLGLHVYSVYNGIGLDPKIGPYMEAFAGGRMMFDDTFGVFAELGGGSVAAIKAGLTMRL